MASLLDAVGNNWPDRMYAHLTPGVAEALGGAWKVGLLGRHRKMLLQNREKLEGIDVSGVDCLSMSDRDEIDRFYAASYPGHWFMPRMLETLHYVGIRESGRLVVVAGVHVFSAERRVAALGNVATALDRRGHGLARRACAALCLQLSTHADLIGLNVEATNSAAIRCYAGLGFEIVADYDEGFLERRSL
jgi:ribosomal protein S18 acetylase RimI-like enzyme